MRHVFEKAKHLDLPVDPPVAQGFLDFPGNGLQPDAGTLRAIHDDALILATFALMLFTGYLIAQRGASPHTIASYRYTLRLLFTWIRDGQLDIRIGGTYPLDEAARAHDDLAARRTTGKLLLLPR